MSLAPHRRDLAMCTFCPKMCRFCCPTAEAEHRETVTPWWKMSQAEMVRLGQLQPAGEIGEVFYHCFGCLHCRTHCRHCVDVPTALLQARGQVVECGAEFQAVSLLMDRIRDSGNPFGEDLRSGLHREVAERFFVPEAGAVLFAGCQAIRQSGFLGTVFRLLSTLGIDTVAAFDGADLCCGAPLWQAGDQKGFSQHAARVKAQLSAHRKIICPCPTCAVVLGSAFTEAGAQLNAEIVHLSVLLGPLLADRKAQRLVPGHFAFHDPCYLGRHLGLVDLPRKILAGVLQQPLAEPIWTKEDASCCGGGGLVPHVLPEVAASAALLRMAQLKATGAERIVTACPGCLRMLGSVPGGLPVLDLTTVLEEAYFVSRAG